MIHNKYIIKIIYIIIVLKIIKSEDEITTMSVISANPESIVFIPNTRVYSDDEYLEDKKTGPIEAKINQRPQTYTPGPSLPTSAPQKEIQYGDTIFIKQMREKSSENFGDLTSIINNKPRSVYDLINNVGGIRVETDTENSQNVFFVTGGNVEKLPEIENFITRDKTNLNPSKPTQVLACKNLTCSRNLSAVCGAKLDNNKWRYRLFYNECYYRKVNCAFNYGSNRFSLVDISKCDGVGKHYPERPEYNPVRITLYKKNNKEGQIARRDFASRRSLNVNLNGKRCIHSCPTSCTEDNVPECAISIRGEKKVFLNHCQLDFNSCRNKLAWRTLPLSECIGFKQAETRENRAFIGWMQKIGIIDAKGRLVSS